MITKPIVFKSESSFSDLRGTYFPLYSHSLSQKASVPSEIDFVQDSICVNHSNVFRGFHGDNHTYKLISPVKGDFILYYFDYNSYISSSSIEVSCLAVSGKNNLSILLPPSYANAYLSLSHDSIYYYKQSTEYGAHQQYTVPVSDSKLKINLPLPIDQLILSKRDSA